MKTKPKPMTEQEIRERFETDLQDAILNGSAAPVDSIWSSTVFNAIWAVAAAYPNISAELIEKARETFEQQLADWRAA